MLAREIRFRNLMFGYPGGVPVLEGLDLVIPAGSSQATVGQNGAGKSTLAGPPRLQDLPEFRPGAEGV
jgi:ATP-binding cassette subfamily B protein